MAPALPDIAPTAIEDPTTPKHERRSRTQVKAETPWFSSNTFGEPPKDEIIDGLRRRAIVAESMVNALEERLEQAGVPVLHWVGPDAQLPDDFPTPKKGAIWKGLVHSEGKSFCAACGQEIPEDKGDEEAGVVEEVDQCNVEATSSPVAWYSP